MIFLCFFIYLQLVLSKKNFPLIKFTKGGIFGWFDALALMKKPFNNKKLFGFRLNSTEPDLSMIVYDIVNNLNLRDINISQKIADFFNNSETTESESKILLLSSEKCSDKSGNSHQLCKMLGIDLNLNSLGITEEHFNILLANLFGYIPTNLFFVIIAIISIIYYIVQIILQYKFFKPSEYSDPSIVSIVIFYIGDALIFISAILFLCAFTGVDHFISTISSLDSVFPRLTYSVASSLSQFIDDGLPNGLNPIFQAIEKVLDTTHFYLRTTIDSFIEPTQLCVQKMVSNDENDLGVFNIYNYKIHTTANKFYEKVKSYPKLDGIDELFMSQDFTSQQQELQNFYDNELNLSTQLNQLDLFFVYYYDIVESLKNYVLNLTNQTLAGDENTTIGEAIEDLKEKSLTSFEFLTDIHKKTKKKNPLWIFLAIIFFFIGIFFMVVPIYIGLIFWMHNKAARCVANTISICPLVSTILMFVLSFLMTGVGFALVAMSNQFELSVDNFLNNVIDVTIPTREIKFNTINITKQTKGNYVGTINLTSIVFPESFPVFQTFVEQDEEEGIASALSLDKVLKMDEYADEIGDFIITLSGNFNLPNNIIQSLNGVKIILKTLGILFPKKIDGFFNWKVPITSATNYLRNEIKSKDPDALTDLEPYLSQIDAYTNQMNSQFDVGIKQITQTLPNSINDLNTVVPRFISSVLNDLGYSTKDLVRNVYPILNTIQSGLIIGPYALVRNVIFYDLANMCAFISASGTLMIFGLVIVVTMIWIRRKGMMHVTGREIGFFEFIFTCRKKKVANDHSCDSMETDDSNIIYLHDSDFDINTSYCNSEFEFNSKSGHCYYNYDSSDDYNNWLIDDDASTSFVFKDNVNNDWCVDDINSIKNDYMCDPADDNDNFCIKEDSDGNYVPQDGYLCDPADDCSNWCLDKDQNGNYTPTKTSYVGDPADDCSNWCIQINSNGAFIPDNNGFVCDPEDDNNNFIVRLDQIDEDYSLSI